MIASITLLVGGLLVSAFVVRQQFAPELTLVRYEKGEGAYDYAVLQLNNKSKLSFCLLEDKSDTNCVGHLVSLKMDNGWSEPLWEWNVPNGYALIEEVGPGESLEIKVPVDHLHRRVAVRLMNPPQYSSPPKGAVRLILWDLKNRSRNNKPVDVWCPTVLTTSSTDPRK